jgi:phospholipase C
MRARTVAVSALAFMSLAAACGSSSSSSGSSSPDAGPPDAAAKQDPSCAGPCPESNVRHVIVLIQENHTFDDHFGGWCKAPAGSAPTCTQGPACCEAMPAAPGGVHPSALTDTATAAYDPPHDAACEAAMMDGGKMDAYATAVVSGETCGDPRNVAAADPATIAPLWALASAGAVADRYFQPVVGESYANDMYFARAQYAFADDTVAPAGAVGVSCGLEAADKETLTGTTIGDLLTAAKVPWTFYAGGYDAMRAADGGCPPKPADCPFPFAFDPCGFEPSDVPFEFYASTRDNPATMKDYADLEQALAGPSGGALPAVSFVKAIEYKSEHPGQSVQESPGVAFIADLAQRVAASRYAADTLLLVTYDEGGGYYDHVAPPPASPVDHKPYGTRVPLLALGPLVHAGAVSHVTMEHSSVVRFIEWNFLGAKTGQLGGRDAVVANLGSLLDPAKTGAQVPE